MKTFIIRIVGSESDDEGGVMIVNANSSASAAAMMIRKAGWSKPDKFVIHGKIFIPSFGDITRSELIADHESGNAGGLLVEELKLNKLYS